MSKVIRTTALFFAAILFFLSTSTQNYGLYITSHLQNTPAENTDSYYSTENPKLLFLYRNDERQVNSGRNVPTPSLKNYSNNIQYKSLSPEIRLLSINSRYYLFSLIVERSLTNSDIVFPFHYFW